MQLIYGCRIINHCGYLQVQFALFHTGVIYSRKIWATSVPGW